MCSLFARRIPSNYLIANTRTRPPTLLVRRTRCGAHLSNAMIFVFSTFRNGANLFQIPWIFFCPRIHQENQYDNKIWQTQKETEWGERKPASHEPKNGIHVEKDAHLRLCANKTEEESRFMWKIDQYVKNQAHLTQWRRTIKCTNEKKNWKEIESLNCFEKSFRLLWINKTTVAFDFSQPIEEHRDTCTHGALVMHARFIRSMYTSSPSSSSSTILPIRLLYKWRNR